MKVSEAWLRECVNPPLTTAELVEQLTMAGLEVDAVEPAATEFSGVIVGEIISAQQHPDADKLTLCQVSNGDSEVQVICGAPNARAGLRVAFAQIGAVLPGDFKIKKAKLRGVESFGMLCGASELGLADDDSGIIELPSDAPLGEDLSDYLKLNDQVIDIDLTPNRGDCLSVKGLARELGVLNQLDLTQPVIAAVEPVINDQFPVRIEDAAACPRYVGRVIKGVDLSAETPLWMQEKLRRSGLRSIDPVVDVTNYILLELGQPLHAFDLSVLKGGITVRRAQQGEKLVLLNGQEVELTDQPLMITDESGPLAMAGIMGGEKSGVSETTTDLFLESAYFSPLAIAGRARSVGLHTDASHRYERGVDFELQRDAMERATALLLELVGGQAGPITDVVSEIDLPKRPSIELRKSKVASMLALTISDDQIVEMLERLGLRIEFSDGNGWTVGVPSYRFDLEIEADLLEELARIYGYNQLPVSLPSASLSPKAKAERIAPLAGIREALLQQGYYEAVTYSFVDPAIQKHFSEPAEVISLANPISSDMADMRTSLWPGLLNALKYNLHRQQSHLRLFETGLVFSRQGESIVQDRAIGGVLTGMRNSEGWSNSKENADFYDLKGHVESLLDKAAGLQYFSFHPGQHRSLHPGQSAEVRKGDETVGFLGALHPSIQQALDINQPVYLFELDLKKISEGEIIRFEPLSKFPEVKRDISIIVEETVMLDDIIKVISEEEGDIFKSVTLFDQYQGENISKGRKSLSLSLTWQDRSRTLTDEDVSPLVNNIINKLETKLNATLRG